MKQFLFLFLFLQPNQRLQAGARLWLLRVCFRFTCELFESQFLNLSKLHWTKPNQTDEIKREQRKGRETSKEALRGTFGKSAKALPILYSKRRGERKKQAEKLVLLLLFLLFSSFLALAFALVWLYQSLLISTSRRQTKREPRPSSLSQASSSRV